MALLNVKALIDLLSQNNDGRLCRRAYLMTVNGTLLAYNRPAVVSQLRQQAAMVALCWRDRQSKHVSLTVGAIHDNEAPSEGGAASLSTMVIESETHNIVIRGIQNDFLLVLEGGIPARRSMSQTRIITEDTHGKHNISQRYRTEPTHDISATSPRPNNVVTAGDDVAQTVLRLQREKLDSIADIIAADFERTGFILPQLANRPIF